MPSQFTSELLEYCEAFNVYSTVMGRRHSQERGQSSISTVSENDRMSVSNECLLTTLSLEQGALYIEERMLSHVLNTDATRSTEFSTGRE